MELTVTSLIVPLGIVLFALWRWLRAPSDRKYYKNVSGPPTLPLIGNALYFSSTSEILDRMMKCIKDYGGIFKMEIGPIQKTIVVADYKIVECMLSSTKELTKSEGYAFALPWLGTGLLTGDGPKWKKHRRMLTPAFHFKILEQFIDVFESCGNTLLKKLEQEVGKDSFDVYPFITLCALDVICETTMGISINAQDDVTSQYVHSVKEMCRIIMERALSPIQMFDLPYFFTKNYRIQRKALRILHEKSNSVIKHKREELETKPKEMIEEEAFTIKKKKAFIDLILEATVDGRPLTQEEIRQEVDTFMFAGHDTTASAMSFAIYCLANHPDVQKLAFEEQQAIFEGNRTPTYADLQNMKYLEKVIKESLRLYPSVPIYGRKAIEDIQCGDLIVPKGDTVLIFSYGVHRDPKYFVDPEKFDPNRFDNIDGKFPYSYIPFSAGPRNCIGQKFAMLEMKSVISKILRTFELQPAVPQHTLKLVSETVLKSLNGIKIRLKLRS